MKPSFLLLLLSTLALSSFQASGMIEAEKSAGKKESEVVDPHQETREYTKEKETEAFIEESKKQGNPNFKPEGFIERGSEKSESKSIEAASKNELSPLEQSAWDTLQPAALAARDAFEELFGLPRDEEGNIFDPSKQEELRPKILNSLEAYEKQRQAWIAQATSERLAEVAILEETTKEITFSIIERLDVSTQEDGAVFWTGYTLENQRTAMAYAKEQGKQTIEMTRDGKLLDQLGMYQPDSPVAENGKSKVGDLLFDAASIKFAQGAFGKVIAVIYQPRTADEQAAYEKSAYARLEEPLLKAREQAGEPVELGKGRVEVPVEITLPVLRALIKENTQLKKGAYLIGELGTHLATGNLSMEKIERIDEILKDINKNEADQHKLQQKAKAPDVTPTAASQLAEELQQAKAHQRELLNRLWNFAEHAHKRAQEAWEKATPLSDKDISFWSQWEKATESAKEAHHSWEEWLHGTQQHILGNEGSTELSTKLTKAEEQKNFWLEKLKTAKVEPPLQLEEEKKAVSILKPMAAISLPEPGEADKKRLELREQINILKTKKKNLKPPAENVEAFLIPNERPRRSSSNASDHPLEKEIELSQKIKEITTEWEKEVRIAEKQRREDLLRNRKEEINFSNDKERFDAWREHDQKILQTRQEIIARKEKEDRNHLLAANWESNTRRWNLRLQADELWERVNVIDNLYRLHNQRSDYNDPAWREADDEIVKVKEHLEKKLQAIRTQWEQRAEEHPEVIKASQQGGKALSEAKEQLKKSDRVILELQKEFKDQVYQGKAYLRPRTLAATEEEVRLCKQALTEQREALLEKVNTHQISIEEYAQRLKWIALKDAKENAPGDCEAWEAFKQSLRVFQTSQSALATANQAATETFFQERNYLDAIQKKWIDQLEELAERRLAAAQAFFQDNPLPWTLLTPQERYYYNAPIRRAQETTRPRDIGNAIAKVEQTYEAIRLLKVDASKATRAALEQEKETHYNNLKQLFESQITQSKRASRAAYQEVERLHAPENQGLFSGPSTKQKQQALDDYGRATASLLTLQAQFQAQERTQDYEKNALSLEEQYQREAVIQARERTHREQYLQWLRLTPQEKKKEVEQLRKDRSEAWSKERKLKGQSEEAVRKKDTKKAERFKAAAEAAGKSSCRLDDATEAKEKAIKAEAQGKQEVVVLWNESAKQHQLAADYWRQSMEAMLQGDLEKARRFKTIAGAAQKSALRLSDATEAQENAIKAEAQGKQEVTAFWNASARQYQLAADYWRQSVAATLQGDLGKAKHFENAAEAAKENGWRLGQVSEVQEKAIEAEAQGKQEAAALWNESTKQYQLLADYWRQNMEVMLQGDLEKAIRFGTAAEAAHRSGWKLDDAAEAQEKAIKAKAQGKQEAAALWNESTKQYQLAADCWRRSIEATLEGDLEKAKRFKAAAEAAEKEAQKIVQTIK